MLSLKNTSKILSIVAGCMCLYSCSPLIDSGTEIMPDENSYTVELQDASEYISASGKIIPADTVCVPAKYSASVDKIYVSVGDSVKTGDKLFSYDVELLKKNKSELEEQLSAMQSENDMTHNMNIQKLESARNDKETALSEAQSCINCAENQKEQLYQKYLDAVNYLDNLNQQLNSASEEDAVKLNEEILLASREADELESELSVCDQSIEEAYSGYRTIAKAQDQIIKEYEFAISLEQFDTKTSSLNKQIAEIQEIIDNADVTADCSGIITEININSGSNPPTNSAVKITNGSSYSALVHINEDDIDKVSVEMPANISLASSNAAYEGSISKIYKTPDDNQNTYPAIIDIKCSDELFLGRNIDSKINVSSKKSAMMIPYEFIGQDKDKKTYVTKYNTDGTTEKVEVEIGIKTVNQAEILSDKIQEGDKLLEIEAE